jgi:hypothetical protein
MGSKMSAIYPCRRQLGELGLKEFNVIKRLLRAPATGSRQVWTDT